MSGRGVRTVTAEDVLGHVPLVSAAVWFLFGIWLSKRAFRTAPERAFAAFALLVGAWALLDWLFRQAADPTSALALARASASILPPTALSFAYFARWLTRSRGVLDYLAVVPAAVGVAIAWTLFASEASVPASGPVVVREPAGLLPWIAIVGGTVVAGCAYLARSLHTATFESPGTRRKLEAILGLIVVGFVIWLYENVRFAPTPSTGNTSPFLLVFGVLFFAAAARITPAKIHGLVRKLLITPARPSIAIWYHKSGHPIAQLILPGEAQLDAEAMGDVTSAIDHVVSRGFSRGQGTLREVRIGDHVLMFEQGQYLSLFVVLRGVPSAGLRSELRAAIREFEALDGTRLRTWETATELAEPALRFLEQVLRPSFS